MDWKNRFNQLQKLIVLLEWCACGPVFDVPKFKPFRPRYITVNRWSIEITDLDGSVLTPGEAKTDVVLVVCWRMVIQIYRIFCRLSTSYTRIAWDWLQSKRSSRCQSSPRHPVYPFRPATLSLCSTEILLKHRKMSRSSDIVKVDHCKGYNINAIV
jgi:hypothetical protein